MRFHVYYRNNTKNKRKLTMLRVFFIFILTFLLQPPIAIVSH